MKFPNKILSLPTWKKGPIMDRFGDRIEYYEILDLLGQGGFAQVYRARCRRSGMDVAIKKIETKKMKEAGMVKRVRQEVEIHSRLKHPCILEVYTFFEDEKFVYLVLELCHNGEMQRFLKDSTVLTEREACSILCQVVSGLLYLHSHQIVHRDISLANLLLTDDMKIKISDFGLATELTRPDEKHMTMCGTPNYISPEIATRASHGLETDVWSVGVMLFTMLVGKAPFDAKEGVRSTLTRVVMSDFIVPSSLSDEANNLISSLLQKNPKERLKLSEIPKHPFILKYSMGLAPSRSVANTSSRPWVSYDSGVASSYQNSSILKSQTQDYMKYKSIPVKRSVSPAQQPKNCRSCGSDYCRGCEYPLLESQIPDIMGSQCSHECAIKCVGPGHLNMCDNGHISNRSNQFTPILPLSYYEDQPKSYMSGCGKPNAVSNHCSKCLSQIESCSHAIGQLHLRKADSVNQCSNRSRGIANDDSILTQNKLTRSSSAERCPRQESAKGSQIEERSQRSLKIRVPPINSARLRPVRQRAKNVIVNILENGEVCLEFIKIKEKTDKISEVLRISQDGMRIVLYQPNLGKGVLVGSSPPPLPSEGADAIYNYENIPEKHWKKYIYASKFVDLVKSKTPKITYYSSAAKCFLMENVPDADFEACFYEGGKISKTGSCIKLVDSTGTLLSFDVSNVPTLHPSLHKMWEHYVECEKHCNNIETVMEGINENPSGTCFPVIVGRRPQKYSKVLQTSNDNKENVSPPTAINIPRIGVFEGSIASIRAGKDWSKGNFSIRT